MAFVVQTDDGLAVGANAYIDEAYLLSYLTDLNKDLSEFTSIQQQAAIIEATRYLDGKYNWVGVILTSTQSTFWPREDVCDQRGEEVLGIPRALKEAVALVAFRVLSGTTLLPDPTVSPAGSPIERELKQVGPLKKEIEYQSNSSYSYTGPTYPEIDNLLRSYGLIQSLSSLYKTSRS